MKILKTIVLLAVISLFIACDPAETNTTEDAANTALSGAESEFESEGDLNTLHDYSVKYRILADMCNSDKANFFELTLRQAQDIVNAMKAIQAEAELAPASYRLIYGKKYDDGTLDKVKLMIVGLNDASGNGSEEGYIRYTKLIDGYLPCPMHCDVAASTIASDSGQCTFLIPEHL